MGESLYQHLIPVTRDHLDSFFNITEYLLYWPDLVRFYEQEVLSGQQFDSRIDILDYFRTYIKLTIHTELNTTKEYVLLSNIVIEH